MLNYLPSKNSVVETMMQSMKVESRGKIYLVLKRIKIVAYSMVYVGTKYTMKTRSILEIALKE